MRLHSRVWVAVVDVVWIEELISQNSTDKTWRTLPSLVYYPISLKLSIVGDGVGLLSMPGSIACPPPLHCPLTFSHIYSTNTHTHTRAHLSTHTHTHTIWQTLNLFTHAQQSYMARAHTRRPMHQWRCMCMTPAEPPVYPGLLKPCSGLNPVVLPLADPLTRATRRQQQRHTATTSCSDKCSRISTSNWWKERQTTTTCVALWNSDYWRSETLDRACWSELVHVDACLSVAVRWILHHCLVRTIFFSFAALRWFGTAWRSWIASGESGFQQAVSLIITHTHTYTHTRCPLWPRPFPAPGWSIGCCLPCDCREREKKRRGKKVCVCVLAACPSESISVSYPWAVPDPWPTLLSIGGLSEFFRWGLKMWEAHRVLPPR